MMQLKPMRKWNRLQIDFWQHIRRFLIKHKVSKDFDFAKRKDKMNFRCYALGYAIDSEEYDYYIANYGMKRCECCDGFGFKEK